MVDWLILWGVSQGVGALVYPILQDLAKDSAKDFVKDFFKDSLKHVALGEKDPRQIATGKALKEFLLLMQQQLKFRCKLTDGEIKKEYQDDVKKFIHHKSVREILAQAFDVNCESLDAEILADTWKDLQIKTLPGNFNWQVVNEQYFIKAQEILWDSEELRAILNSQNLQGIQENTKELAGIVADFNLGKYQESIQ